MTEKKHIFLEFILIMIFILIFNSIFNYNLFDKCIWEWTMIIGISYLAISPLNFVLYPIKHSIMNVILGISITIPSFFLERNENPYLSPVFDKEKIEQRDGNHIYSKWLITITYMNKYGLEDSHTGEFLGSVSSLDKYIKDLETNWTNEYTGTTFVRVDRGLL